MTSDRVGDRAILRLAVPALGALAVDPLLSLADTAFVARLGVTELAALGVDTALLGFAFIAFNFLAYAVTPLVAQALGRGDHDGARRWVGEAMVLALGLGVLATVALQLLAPWAVALMGADESVAPPAVSYLRIRALAAPAVLVVTAGHGAFRGHQDTRTPLRVALVVNLINLGLDPVLIFWAGLGLEGAAWATVAAQAVGAAWFIRLLRDRGMISTPARLRASSLMVLGRSGLLVTARTGALLLGLAFAAATATRIGPAEIAAHQVVMQVWLLAAMVTDSFAIAAQAMVGAAVGASDPERTRALTRRLLRWGLATGLGLLAAFHWGGPLLGRLSTDAEVSGLIASAAEVAGWMMPAAALVFVADGVFFGLFALGAILRSTVSGSLLLAAVLWLTPLGESLGGVWWGIGLMVLARGAVYLLAYRGSVRASLSR